jgi:hypothetical protein
MMVMEHMGWWVSPFAVMFDDARACPGASLSPLSKTIHHAIGLYYTKYVNDRGCDLDQRAGSLLLRLNTSSRFLRVGYQKGSGGKAL